MADTSAPFDAARLANAAIGGLAAYDPGHDLPTLRRRFGAVLAELGSNENPLGPSPGALRAVREADAMLLARYPDPRGAGLKQALAGHLGVDTARITLGNGSHELLMLLAQCFADCSHSIVHSQFGFAVFAIATAAVGAHAIRVPALPGDDPQAPFGHDLAAIAAAVRADTRLVYLANPNNPTGTWFDDAALADFLARVPRDVLVVVDEAYREYVTAPAFDGALPLAGRHPNLVVTRTFSKAWGLAGLRLGYLIADPGVGAVLERLRESFNVNALALAAARAALADGGHLARVRRENAAEREWLCAELDARGLRTLPSQANFVLLVLDHDAAALEARLRERGVVVRPMGGYGLPQTLRISVGSRAENRRLVDALA
jgi:histidinol-phosphate aminotransferase